MELVNTILREKGLDELKRLHRSLSRAAAARRSPFDSTHEHEAFQLQLGELIRQKEAQRNTQPRTREQEIEDEVERLAREHHVSVKVARAYVERQERDPLSVARNHRVPAPAPFEPEATKEKYTDERLDLRPYRRQQQ